MAKIAVAPLVGAWIEIKKTHIPSENSVVAPLVGAWIEIKSLLRGFWYIKSLPSWERGLKLSLLQMVITPTGSLPSWERGLKSTG